MKTLIFFGGGGGGGSHAFSVESRLPLYVDIHVYILEMYRIFLKPQIF